MKIRHTKNCHQLELVLSVAHGGVNEQQKYFSGREKLFSSVSSVLSLVVVVARFAGRKNIFISTKKIKVRCQNDPSRNNKKFFFLSV
jgi:hypothetical protein